MDTAGSDTSADAPLALTTGTVHRMSLDANGEWYLSGFADPPGKVLPIMIDMRRVDGRNSNLQSSLAVLDVNGAVLQDRFINFNEIGTRARKTATLPLRRSESNRIQAAERRRGCRLLVHRPSRAGAGIRSILGSLMPMPLEVGEQASGVLDKKRGFWYYVLSAPEGDYQVIIDFANAEKRNTNIQGLVAMLDGDGGNYRKIVGSMESTSRHERRRRSGSATGERCCMS